MSTNIIILDSNEEHSKMLSEYLVEHGYAVNVVVESDDLYKELEHINEEENSELLLIDALIKNEDSLEICKRVRQISNIPMILYSKHAESSDKVLGLEMGADDYISKPFDKRELLARIRVLIRRAAYYSETANRGVLSFTFEGWELDGSSRNLINPEGSIIELSGAEYRLLHYFLSNPQIVLSREKLVDKIQGRYDQLERSPFDRSIDVQVSRLRARLEDNKRTKKFIKTVRGDGYVFTASVNIKN